MKKFISPLLALAFFLIGYSHAVAAVWVNNTPGALVTRIEIYQDNGSILPGNPLLPIDGYANITFQNGVEYLALALHPIAGSISPSFFPALLADDYTQFTVYHCDVAASPPNTQTCDGIALRLQSGQLCAGFFQYNTLVDRVGLIADIGCFTMTSIAIPSLVSKRDILQKYSKEQLIAIIGGLKPNIPIGPICLSCPPWDGYKKDINLTLEKLKVKRFRIEMKNIN